MYHILKVPVCLLPVHIHMYLSINRVGKISYCMYVHSQLAELYSQLISQNARDIQQSCEPSCEAYEEASSIKYTPKATP